MDFMQIFTFLTGVAYMILEIRQKNFMWVVGIATSLAAMWVSIQQGFYASFGLNTYYLITSFIGLWQWRSARRKLTKSAAAGDSVGSDLQGDVIVLKHLTWTTAMLSAVLCVAGTIALSIGMTAMYKCGILHENPMSLLDSLVAVLSAVATWWLVKSYREQWVLWIVADALSVALWATQGMWWMVALYLAYVAAAVYGLYYWRIHGVYLSDK